MLNQSSSDSSLGSVRSRFVLFGLILAQLLSLTGCSTDSTSDMRSEVNSGTQRIQVVVTIGMLADVVRAIGGDRVEVHSLMGCGVDPHLYRATRDDVLRIRDAEIVFYCGLMLEGKMSEMLRKSSGTQRVVAVAEALPKEKLLSSTDREHPDPHLWMDVALWQEVSREVERVLSEYRPDARAYFQQQLEDWLAKLERLDEYGKRVMATIEPQKRMLLTSHDAFRYFGRRYGLEVLAVQGISTDSEAGLYRIRELVDLIVDRQIEAVFVESSVPPDSIQTLVRGAAARGFVTKIGGELYSDAMGAPGTYDGTYIGMMDHNLTTVARLLGGEPPEHGFASENP